MSDSQPSQDRLAPERDPVAARKKLEVASTLHWVHWVVIAGSLLLTFGAWYYSKSQLEGRVEARFDRESDRVVELIQERMAKYEDALWGGVAFIHAGGGDVEFEPWQSYAESLRLPRKYPGINGIGVIQNVEPEDLESYLALQRKSRPDFKIHPPHERTPGNLPISFVIPVEGNEQAVGLDMAHETNRYTAAMKARDTAEAQITGPITLVQDSGKTPGFLFYAPYYSGGDVHIKAEDRREQFAGMVYAPFVVKRLMAGTLEAGKRNVAVKINDGDSVLFNEHVASAPNFDDQPLYKRSVNAKIYGRTWHFEIWSAKSFRTAAADSQPLTILIGGILIDLLLVVLFVSISRSSKQALNYANTMTHQLEENNAALHDSNQELAVLQARFKNTLDSAPVGILMVNRGGQIVLLNQHAENMFGYETDELLNKPLEELVPHRFRELHVQYRADYFNDPSKRRVNGGNDLLCLRKDGSEFAAEIGLTPIIEGGETFVLSAISDITQRKELQDDLRQSNEALTKSNIELQQFAYVASHDLQTPLRGIAGFAEILRSKYQGQLDETADRYMDKIVAASMRMQTLINDLLVFSRVESSSAPLSSVDLNDTLADAKELLQAEITATGAAVTSDELPVVNGDASQLAQLLQNLIGNGLKYRGDNTPEIHISAQRSGDLWTVAIRDNGIGIDKKHYDQIFEIFKRLHTQREYAGTGIGLAVCKRIVLRHGGRIWLESEPGKGTTFLFTLHVAKEVASAS